MLLVRGGIRDASSAFFWKVRFFRIVSLRICPCMNLSQPTTNGSPSLRIASNAHSSSFVTSSALLLVFLPVRKQLPVDLNLKNSRTSFRSWSFKSLFRNKGEVFGTLYNNSKARSYKPCLRFFRKRHLRSKNRKATFMLKAWVSNKNRDNYPLQNVSAFHISIGLKFILTQWLIKKDTGTPGHRL